MPLSTLPSYTPGAGGIPFANPSSEGDRRDDLNSILGMSGLVLQGPVPGSVSEVISGESLRFIGLLSARFGSQREELLKERSRWQSHIDGGSLPGFDPASAALRRADWEVVPPPPDLADRRVEITGPTDRKMMINALNSGAQVFLADMEDSHAPVWALTLRGQRNLLDAARGKMEHSTPDGKQYALRADPATLMFRPRGWHLEEAGLLYQGHPVPASFFDFGLFVQSCAGPLRSRGHGTYLYLPKLQSAGEAQLWNDVMSFTEETLGLPAATIRAAVLVETLPGIFQMHEILHALRERSLGLNFGRWDYLFSFIKTLRANPHYLLPDRNSLSMNTPFMRAASQLIVETCHARGAQAIGGMTAQIPVKEDAGLDEEAKALVTADKLRELGQGYDGTWVAHPGLVPIAQGIFHTPPSDRKGSRPRPREVDPDPSALLEVPGGKVTARGLYADIDVGVRYLESWLRGNGAAAIHYRMEDTATAEICRSQLWQWVHAGVTLDDGRRITPSLFLDELNGQLATIHQEVGDARWEQGEFSRAGELLKEIVTDGEMAEFLPPRAASFLQRGNLGYQT